MVKIEQTRKSYERQEIPATSIEKTRKRMNQKGDQFFNIFSNALRSEEIAILPVSDYFYSSLTSSPEEQLQFNSTLSLSE